MAKAVSPGRRFGWPAFFPVLYPLIGFSSLVDHSLIPRWIYTGIVAAVLLFLEYRTPKEKRAEADLPFVFLLALALWQAASAAWALNPADSWNTASHWFIAAALYRGLRNGISAGLFTPLDLSKGWSIFGLIAGLWALSEIGKMSSERDFWDAVYQVKAGFGHKNLLSGALFLALPFTLRLLRTGKGGWKLLAFLTLAVLVIDLVLLRTRAVWLGAGIAVVFAAVWYFVRKSERLALVTSALLPVLLIAVAALLIGVGVKSRLSDQANLDRRQQFWHNSVEMIKERPITGVGAGNWRIWYPKYGLGNVDKNVNNGVTHIQRPHNDVLWVWSESGPVGLFLFAGLFFLFFFHGNKAMAAGEGMAGATGITLAAVAGYWVYHLFDFPLERGEHQALLVSLLVLVPYPQIRIGKKLSLPLLMVVLGSVYIQLQRFGGEKKSVDVLRANEKKDARGIIPAAENAINPWYTMDNFGNSLRYYSGMGHFALEQMPEALDDFREAEKITPYNIVLLNQLGSWYKVNKDYEAALDVYDRTLVISPFMEAALLNAAETCMYMEDWNRAYGYLERVYLNSENQKYYGLAREIIPRWYRQRLAEDAKGPMMELLQGKNSPEAMAEAWILQRRGAR